MKIRKRHSKFISFILAMLLVFSTIPAVADTYQETENELVLENFDILNSNNFSEVVTNTSGYASLSDEYSETGRYSLKISSAGQDISGADKTVYGSFDISLPAVGSIITERNLSGIKFWLKNPSGNDIILDVRTHAGDRLVPGRSFYIADKSGTTAAGKTFENTDFYKRGAITVPKDFEGFVYLPYTSFESIDYSKLRFSVCPLSIHESALYLDSISAYAALPEEIVYESFEDGSYSAVLEINSSVSEDCAYHGSYSLKLSTAGITEGIDKDYVRSRISLSNPLPSNANLKMWLKNTSSKPLKLDLRTNAGDGLKSNAVYYLEDGTGAVKSFKTLVNTEFYSRSAVIIPAGFEGFIYLPYSVFTAPNHQFIQISVKYDALWDGALYIDGIQNYISAPEISLIENFDYGDYKLQTNGAEVTKETAFSGDSSLKLFTDGGASDEEKPENYLLATVTPSGGFSIASGSGIKLWVKNNSGNDLKFGIWTNGSDKLKVGADYYLTDYSGAAVKRSTVNNNGFYSHGNTVIPAGFEGWLLIPYTSFSSLSSAFIRMSVHMNAVSSGALYVDSIGNYYAAPDSRLIENFDYDVKFTIQGISSLCTDLAQSGTASLKITSQGTEVEESYKDNYSLIRFTPFSAKADGGDVYKLWMKNTASNDIKFDIRTEGGNQLKANAVYYLSDKNGNVSGNVVAANASFYNRGQALIPEGFEGWMYIPVSSFTTDFINEITISIDPLQVNDGALYIDSISSCNQALQPLIYDADGNGAADIRDLIRLKKFIADNSIFISFLACDMDENGKLNSEDLATFRKHFLGVGQTVSAAEHTDTEEGFGGEEISVIRPSGNMTEVYASAFGLNEASADNTLAMQNALDYCAQNENTKLIVEEGKYYFRRNLALSLDGAKNIIIEGNGAEFIFSEIISEGYFLGVLNSANCSVQNLKIDWNWNCERLADVIKVVSNDQNGITFEFIETGKAPDTFEGVTLDQCDPLTYSAGIENGKAYRISQLNIESTVKTADNRLMLQCRELARLAVGETYILYHYNYGTHAVAAMGCTNLTLENITVYSAPGMAFSVNRSDHFQVLDCNVTLRPESGRHVSSTADSLHIGNGKGYFIIEGCDFGYMGDDALNIHTDTNRIEKRVSEKTLLLGSFMRPVEGTLYSFRDASFGVIDFSAKVVNVQTEENGYRVEFETALPENIKAGCTVFQTEEAADYYIVRNNRFHNNRTRGVLLGTGNGIFEDNIIERTRGQAVLISVDQTQNWSEGSGVKNLVFRNNTLKDCNVNGWGKGVIELKCDLFGAVPDTVVINNIWFDGNQFINSFVSAFNICCADNVSVTGNTFEDPDTRLNNSADRAVIDISKSHIIKVSGNIWKRSDYVSNPACVRVAEADRESLVTTENNIVE